LILTREELAAYFDIVDDDKRAFALDTIDEYLFFKEQIDRLRGLPLIRVSKSDPARQVATPAAKLIKDYSQVLDAKRGTLLRILYRVENSAADDLLKKLADFE
jgi:hypothetical protein